VAIRGRPLVNTTPLFVIGLTALFLRGEEKIIDSW